MLGSAPPIWTDQFGRTKLGARGDGPLPCVTPVLPRRSWSADEPERFAQRGDCRGAARRDPARPVPPGGTASRPSAIWPSASACIAARCARPSSASSSWAWRASVRAAPGSRLSRKPASTWSSTCSVSRIRPTPRWWTRCSKMMSALFSLAARLCAERADDRPTRGDRGAARGGSSAKTPTASRDAVRLDPAARRSLRRGESQHGPHPGAARRENPLHEFASRCLTRPHPNGSRAGHFRRLSQRNRGPRRPAAASKAAYELTHAHATPRRRNSLAGGASDNDRRAEARVMKQDSPEFSSSPSRSSPWRPSPAPCCSSRPRLRSRRSRTERALTTVRTVVPRPQRHPAPGSQPGDRGPAHRERRWCPRSRAALPGFRPPSYPAASSAKASKLLEIEPRDYEMAVAARPRGPRPGRQRARVRGGGAEATGGSLGAGRGEHRPTLTSPPHGARRRTRASTRRASPSSRPSGISRARRSSRPSKGRVREKQVDVGQFVSRGAPVATIYATDYAEIRLPIADRQLAFLQLPSLRNPEAGSGPSVLLSAHFGGRRHEWTGPGGPHRGRDRFHAVAWCTSSPGWSVPMTRRKTRPRASPTSRPWRSDSSCTRRSRDRSSRDVIVVPRYAMRDDAHILVVDSDERLRTREVEVLRIDRDDVLIRTPPSNRVTASASRRCRWWSRGCPSNALAGRVRQGRAREPESSPGSCATPWPQTSSCSSCWSAACSLCPSSSRRSSRPSISTSPR